jgi:predicted transposase YdaD
MTIPFKTFYEEALEKGWDGGKQEGRQEGLEIAALGLLKDGDSVERLKKLLGLPEERLRELEAQARSQGASDPEAS